MPFYGAPGMQNPYMLMQDPVQSLSLAGMMQGGSPNFSVPGDGGGSPNFSMPGDGARRALPPDGGIRAPQGTGQLSPQEIAMVIQQGGQPARPSVQQGTPVPGQPGAAYWSGGPGGGMGGPSPGFAGMFQQPAFLQQLMQMLSGQSGPQWSGPAPPGAGMAYGSPFGQPVQFGNDMIGGRPTFPTPSQAPPQAPPQAQPQQSQPKGDDDWFGRYRGPYKGLPFDDVVYLNSLRGWGMGKDYTPDPSLVQRYGSTPTARGDRRIPTGPGQGGGGARRALPPDGGVRTPPMSGQPTQPPVPANDRPRGYRGAGVGNRRQMLG